MFSFLKLNPVFARGRNLHQDSLNLLYRHLYEYTWKFAPLHPSVLLSFTFSLALYIFWIKARTSYFFNNWVYTTNHKRIAVNYFWFVILSGVVGMVLATAIRLEFAYPGVGVFAGDSLQYLTVVSAHGVIMVFFMIMPLLFGAFGNFLLPTQLGVHDVAFPRLNSAAFWFLPGGLLMLAQLICVDRRFQRMNCFNMREVQAILKQRFFADLQDESEHHSFLDHTLIGLKLKIGGDTTLTSNEMIFSNFPIIGAGANRWFGIGSGTSSLLTPEWGTNSFSGSYFSRSLILGWKRISSPIRTWQLLLDFWNSHLSYEKVALQVQLFQLFVASFPLYLKSLVVTLLFSLFKKLENSLFLLQDVWASLPQLTLPTLRGFTDSFVRIFELLNFFVTSLPLLPVSPFSRFWALLTSKLGLSPAHTFVNREESLSSKILGETSLSNFLNPLHFFEETGHDSRFLRSTNPLFKYDYKGGDYLPKKSRETFSFLFPSISNVSGALRPSAWFLSLSLAEGFQSSFNLFSGGTSFGLKGENFSYQQRGGITPHHFFPLSLFAQYANDGILISQAWDSLAHMSMKFTKMFLSSPMQHRIYANWRQLRFTREAWRCKLLSTRHQRTFYRRYVDDDGTFWSIERNAKDLIPGWAMITPFSSRTRFTAIGKVDIGLIGVLLVLNSSIVSGANFLVTYRYLSTLNNRKMRDARSFFAEGVMVASWMMVAANPMLVIGIVMLLCDRHWQTSFFDYSGGGDTVLFQHMFWFFGHPEVYIIMIPTFGFVNTILSYYLRKRVSARASLMYSMYTIAFLGFFVWGHHMYMVGLAHTTRMLFSTLTVMISVPAATKLMHWCVTIANSTFIVEVPLMFTLTFIFFFISGGISGMCVAHTGMDVLFHDTFYVIGHFHVMLSGAAMFGSWGAFYFYFPAIFGVKYSRIYAYFHYSYYLIGQFMTVIPMFWLGYAGMPRRVLDYPSSMGGWHSVISAGHLMSVAGVLSFFFMIFDSLRQSRASVRNSFGVNRFNTRLSFYIFEIARLGRHFNKHSYLVRNFNNYSHSTGISRPENWELSETVLFSYSVSASPINAK